MYERDILSNISKSLETTSKYTFTQFSHLQNSPRPVRSNKKSWWNLWKFLSARDRKRWLHYGSSELLKTTSRRFTYDLNQERNLLVGQFLPLFKMLTCPSFLTSRTNEKKGLQLKILSHPKLHKTVIKIRSCMENWKYVYLFM